MQPVQEMEQEGLTAEAKSQIEDVRAEMKAEVAGVKTELALLHEKLDKVLAAITK
jgi:hypothetical protein